MGNRVTVKPHAELVLIRRIRKGGRGHHMGTVMLKNVMVTSEGLEGDMLDEFTEVRELGADALKVMSRIILTDRGFITQQADEDYARAALEAAQSGADAPELPETLTGQTFRAAYVCGPEFYVSAPEKG